MRSKERASGIPWDMPLDPDLIESWIDFCLVSPEMEAAEEGRETRSGRRYVKGYTILAKRVWVEKSRRVVEGGRR
jgi:hypothetical protein